MHEPDEKNDAHNRSVSPASKLNAEATFNKNEKEIDHGLDLHYEKRNK